MPWSHPAHLFALAVAVACVLVSVSFRLYDYDVWQHLTVGKAIWRLGIIPRTQLWTWPDFGTPVVNPSWGFSALLWPFWSLGADWGLATWRWVTTLVLFFFLWRTSRALGARSIATIVVFVVCALVYRQRSQVRPETLAAPLLAIELWLLEARGRGGAVRDLALVLLVLAWANVHLSYVLAFVPLGIAWLEAGSGGSPEQRRARTALGRVLAAAAVAAFLNPFGWKAAWRPFQFALEWRNDPFMAGISELRGIDWSANLTNGLPLLLAGWPALATWRRRRHGGGFAELGLCAVFSLLALSGSRFVATYAVVAAPYLARDVDEWVRSRRSPRWNASPWRQAVTAAAIGLALSSYEWTHYEDRLGIHPDLRRVPVAACDFMAAHGVRGRGINDFYLGGYMLWRFWPDRSRLPFFDIHPEDKSPEARLAYLQAFSSRLGWERLDGRYRFDYALLSRSYLRRPGLADLLDRLPDWALVSVDDAAALYVRRTGPLAAIADAYGCRELPGGGMKLTQLTAACARDPRLASEVGAELARQSASSPLQGSFASLRRACEQGTRAGTRRP